ncbi:MAG: Na(+)-translocating NADH-quinone reductase subunit A [Bacteroidota bacterium]
MGLTKIKKGLNLPISGKPNQIVSGAKVVKHAALIGDDYVGLKPTFLVQVGDVVKLGQPLFTDKKMPEVQFTSPACGKVVEINRGEKRIFRSLIIELQGNDEVTFENFNDNQLSGLSQEKVKEILLASGLWSSLRTRPFSKIANPESKPHSIFITAMDTNPLAPSISKLIEGNENNFKTGLKVIEKLTEGSVFLCKDPETQIPIIDSTKLKVEEFTGPHPAGNVGTHIHFLDPVSRTKTVWHINLQDVSAIGHLFTTGKILTERIIALGGYGFKEPRLVKTQLGASIADITANELVEGEIRLISGSVLSGFTAKDDLNYLGRYHQQISAIKEGRDRKFFGWMSPGFNMYSFKNTVMSKIIPNKKYELTTAVHGGKRSIVPSGSFEEVMPMDIIPTYLLRALSVDDVEEAEKLGALELDEEDLALCTFTCPSKVEYGSILRRNLSLIEKEG